MATTIYASAAAQVNPPGYQEVYRHVYGIPAPDQEVVVESINFTTAQVGPILLGSIGQWVTQLQQEAQAHGSEMYALVLYRKSISPVEMTVPTGQWCPNLPVFGEVCVGFPFAGDTILAVEEWQLMAVHSQFQFAIAVVALAVAFGIVMLILTNIHNEPGAFKNIANDLATIFGGGQTGAITKEFIIFALAAGAFSIGAYLILRDITQSTGLSATSVRVPGTPSIPQLQNPNPGVQFSTPYGQIGVTPQRGVGLTTDLGQRQRAQRATLARQASESSARQARQQAAFQADQRRREAAAQLAEARARQAAAREAA